jgi:hypothetical protein
MDMFGSLTLPVIWLPVLNFAGYRVRSGLGPVGCEKVLNSAHAIRRAAVLRPDFAFVAKLTPGDGGALLATELQKASPKTTPMVLDVLPGVGVSYAWDQKSRSSCL